MSECPLTPLELPPTAPAASESARLLRGFESLLDQLDDLAAAGELSDEEYVALCERVHGRTGAMLESAGAEPVPAVIWLVVRVTDETLHAGAWLHLSEVRQLVQPWFYSKEQAEAAAERLNQQRCGRGPFRVARCVIQEAP